MTSTVAVTGANGFIGSHLCTGLMEGGFRVRALVRTGTETWDDRMEAFRVVDYFDETSLAVALRGVDAVVHLAGRAHILDEHDSDPESAFRRVNVEMTERVLSAAIAGGARHFVYGSSIAVVGTSSGNVISDATPPRPTTAYARSKLAAEGIVRTRGSAAGLTVTILRPPLVFGPRMAGNPLLLFDAVAARRTLPVGALRNRRSFTYVENVVAGIIAALQCERAAEGTFCLSDDIVLSTPDFARAAAAALGIAANIVSIPLPILRIVATIGSIVSSVVSLPLTLERLERLGGSMVVDSSAFWRAVGQAPPIGVDEGMRCTADWILEQPR